MMLAAKDFVSLLWGVSVSLGGIRVRETGGQ